SQACGHRAKGGEVDPFDYRLLVRPRGVYRDRRGRHCLTGAREAAIDWIRAEPPVDARADHDAPPSLPLALAAGGAVGVAGAGSSSSSSSSEPSSRNSHSSPESSSINARTSVTSASRTPSGSALIDSTACGHSSLLTSQCSALLASSRPAALSS